MNKKGAIFFSNQCPSEFSFGQWKKGTNQPAHKKVNELGKVGMVPYSELNDKSLLCQRIKYVPELLNEF